VCAAIKVRKKDPTHGWMTDRYIMLIIRSGHHNNNSTVL